MTLTTINQNTSHLKGVPLEANPSRKMTAKLDATDPRIGDIEPGRSWVHYQRGTEDSLLFSQARPDTQGLRSTKLRINTDTGSSCTSSVLRDKG